MKRYFENGPFSFFSYGGTADRYFTTESRPDYFRDIPNVALQKSLVFFDPDNGLEPAGKATTAHLRYEELDHVFDRMDDRSVAVIYQHLPRIEGSRFWPSIASALRQRLDRPAAYIAESDLAFFVVPRHKGRMKSVLSILDKQARVVAPGKPPRRVSRSD